jgi:hypothetical protein
MATEYNEEEDRAIQQELTSLKNMNVSALESQQQALQMIKDGFTTEQIAEALGYSVDVIRNFTQLKVEVGSPEEVLQESLRTIVSLIPIAEAQYRERPAATFAYTLCGFIESARALIQQADALRDKETVYRNILAKCLQPFCREMIKNMLAEVAVLNSNQGAHSSDDLKTFSTNLGKKFQECYRKSTEDLALVLGVSASIRTKIISGVDDA